MKIREIKLRLNREQQNKKDPFRKELVPTPSWQEIRTFLEGEFTDSLSQRQVLRNVQDSSKL
ncbi:hypothetical protein C7B82_03755 [Stenomitos frigidus ULC18]|uniref:Uncharacterized protein n=1 Tax=Stenomitos frigidus ULC18 TaxID=2107698 RepID=A0A2T1ELI4_9CYAN|nr:hypothetical protein C7B82_03755 [Stenomitos frigidus ULC18]